MNDEIPFDPATRRLCPDGSCVGILDRDGRCSECGTAGDPNGDPVAAEGDLAMGNGGRGGVDPAAQTVDGGFDPGRKLCDDGSCVGVVGADGKCDVCGRRGEG